MRHLINKYGFAVLGSGLVLVSVVIAWTQSFRPYCTFEMAQQAPQLGYAICHEPWTGRMAVQRLVFSTSRETNVVEPRSALGNH
jgi:hypothetical protein